MTDLDRAIRFNIDNCLNKDLPFHVRKESFQRARKLHAERSQADILKMEKEQGLI